MKMLTRLVPKIILGLLLVGGTLGVVTATAQPARAGVVVSVGFGAGYAPGYHWYRWHDGYGWHRRWAPLAWAPPVAYGPPVAYAPIAVYGPGYVRPGYARPVFYGRYRYRPYWR
jgi:hypothetical protein